MSENASAVIVESTVKRYRHFRIRAEDFQDEDNFQVALASEFPVEQRADEEDERLGIATRGEKYWEVLSHEPGDVDLSRLNDSGSFLDEHKDNRHLGKIKRAVVSDDKVTRLFVWFDGITKLSKTRKEQMRSGSRPHMSAGYHRTRYLGKRVLSDGRTTHRFAWLGLEGSSVAVPADPTVGKGRSKRDDDAEMRCMRCGGLFERKELNEDYICEECEEAETPAEETNRSVGESAKRSFALEKLGFVDEFRMFRAKKDEPAVSFRDLHEAVYQAARSDKRFKSKDENGNTHSDFYVHDVGHRGGDYHAMIVGPENKLYEVQVDYDGEMAILGEVMEMEQAYVPKERKQRAGKKPYGDVAYADPGYQEDGVHRYPIDTKEHAEAAWKYINKKSNADKYTPEQLAHIKSKIKAACKHFGVEISDDKERGVDLSESSRANERKNLIPMNTAELTKEHPELVKEIRSEAERTTRTAIEEGAKQVSSKRKARNDEIHALADTYVKEKGHRWNGKPGEVYICGERIRSLEMEACNAPDDQDSSEVRREFKRKVNDILEGSREPKNPEEAATLDSGLADRCSLGHILRSAAKSKERTACWMPKDGAEAEANTELRTRAAEFPGIGAELEGLQFPMNASSGVRPDTALGRAIPMARSLGGRRKRDALAGDFTTAGAMIAPDYRFPIIELLRNFPALSRAGMTILSGLLGPVTLPRQTSATVGQTAAEGDQLVQYDQSFDQIRMNPHRIGTSQNYSRLALVEVPPDFEAMIMGDHMAVMALKIDALLLNGQGGNNEPLGALNQIIPTVAFAGSAANAFKNAVLMETNVRKTNIIEEGSYISTSVGRGSLMSTAKLLTGATTVVANAVWQDEEVAGRPAWDSQQIPNDILLYGVFRHLVMAQWGGLAVVLDTLTRADRDQYRLTTNTYIDGALRHNSAVCRSVDSIASLS